MCRQSPHTPAHGFMANEGLKPVLHQDVRVRRSCCPCSYWGRFNTQLWTNIADRQILLPTDRQSGEVNTNVVCCKRGLTNVPVLIRPERSASHATKNIASSPKPIDNTVAALSKARCTKIAFPKCKKLSSCTEWA